MKHILLFAFLFISSLGYGQTFTTWTAQESGDWRTLRWDATGETNCTDCGPPSDGGGVGDEDAIVIPVGVTVGLDPAPFDSFTISLSDVVIYVRGTLNMESGFFSIPTLNLTGAGAGLIVEGTGVIGFVDDIIGDEDIININVNGTTVWNAEDDAPFSGPSTLPATSADPLPVTLISFSVFKNGNFIEIQWSTASELNNDYFTIEESVDGFNYESVAEVKGKGTTYQQQYYSYTFSPFHKNTEALYYRLKQTDFDGTFDYSHVVSVNMEGSDFGLEKMQVFPNPIRVGQFYVTNPGVSVQSIRVIDLTGKEVLTERFAGGNVSYQIPLEMPRVKPGIYMLLLTGDKGVESTKLFVE